MQEIEYDPPAVSTFSYLRSKDSQDGVIDLLNDLGGILKERNMIEKEVHLPQRKKLEIKYNDYSKKHPKIKYSEKWIDDGNRIAGVHPITSLPFFLNSMGSMICRFCESEMDIEEISRELKRMYPSVSEYILLKDLLSFLLLLDEMDLIDFSG